MNHDPGLPHGPTCCAGSGLGKKRPGATRALALATNDSERRYLERRLREVQPQE